MKGLGIEKAFVEEKSFDCLLKNGKDFKKQRWAESQAFQVQRKAFLKTAEKDVLGEH